RALKWRIPGRCCLLRNGPANLGKVLTLNSADNPSVSNLPRLTEDEISLRKRWLDFAPEDEQLIAELDPIFSRHLDEIIEDMYAHFFAFEETRAFFPDEATLIRARTAQHAYFTRLTKGNYGIEYVQDRLRVGATHYRIDLDPKWYLGAYNHVVAAVLPLLRD